MFTPQFPIMWDNNVGGCHIEWPDIDGQICSQGRIKDVGMPSTSEEKREMG